MDATTPEPRRATLPLAGRTVLDLSKVIAGPLCGQWLGDLGAEVIKVEPVEGGDETRGWPPFRGGESASCMSLNRNKRSIALDLKAEEGRAIVRRLAAGADVAIQGFGSGTAERLGVDRASLVAARPDLIYCEISGFGRDGPLGDRPGYDVMVQAFSGLVSTMGEPGGGVVRASFSPVDQATAQHALSGILAALIERERNGRGVLVEVSLLDSAMGLMGYMAANYWTSGALPRRMGSAHPLLCPYQALDTADGVIMLAVGNDAQWRRFCAAAGIGPERDDPRFATNAARVAHFQGTIDLVQAVLSRRTTAAWCEALTAASVPCSPVNTLDAALAHPQVAGRGLLREDWHSTLGRVPSVGYPVRLDGGFQPGGLPPPLHGGHTSEILGGLGYSGAEIAGLFARGVVAGS